MSPDPSSVAAVAVLGDELRRRMYAFIRRAGRPITREEAAENVGISRKLAAFHLDKLVTAGLLRAGYADQSGLRRVGRAPKVYEPADVEVKVSIPPREHDLLAGILLDAVLTEADHGGDARDAATAVAAERGRRLGADERARIRGRLGAERALTCAQHVLERLGFEPARAAATSLRLGNCPFHPLAARAPGLVCGINHAFLSGLLDGLRASTVRAVLAPAEGACCVVLEAAPGGSTDG